jgi:hypothetical protein
LPNEDLESIFNRWLVEHDGAVLKVARCYTFTTEHCQDLAQEELESLLMGLKDETLDVSVPGGAE